MNFYESFDFLGWVFVEHPSVSIIDTSSLMFWTTFHRSEFMWYDPPETATAVHVNLWVGQSVIHAIGWVANRRFKKEKYLKKKHGFFVLRFAGPKNESSRTSGTPLPSWLVTRQSTARLLNQSLQRKNHSVKLNTLQKTNLSLIKGSWEDHFPFPQVGYLSLQDGNCVPLNF